MLTYPRTQYQPVEIIDLSDQQERERLSAGALQAFFNIMSHWKIKDEDARKLLGGIGNGTYYDYKKHPLRVLDQDKLTRISYLIGMFKALNILHSQPLADRWVQLPNRNRLFGGQTPLAYMIKGGTTAMQIVRRLLDARRAGQ